MVGIMLIQTNGNGCEKDATMRARLKKCEHPCSYNRPRGQFDRECRMLEGVICKSQDGVCNEGKRSISCINSGAGGQCASSKAFEGDKKEQRDKRAYR